MAACPVTPTSTEGGLSNGTFGYVCPNGSDNACNGAVTDTIAIPGSIAVGASFSLLYTPSSVTMNLEPGALESSTPSILGGSAGNFDFIAAGTASILVQAPGGVLDFVSVSSEDVTGFTAAATLPGFLCQTPPPPAPDAGAADAGATDADIPVDAGTVMNLGPVVIPQGSALDLDLEPIGSDGQELAGNVALSVTSSDDTIVSIDPSSLDDAHAFELCGAGVGTAVITVTIQGQASSSFLVTVGAP